MDAIVSNLKFNITSFKISPNEIKRFLILTINNKYAKNAPILQFLLRLLANSIVVFSHSFCWKIENQDCNNKSNKSEIEKKIKLEDEIN